MTKLLSTMLILAVLVSTGLSATITSITQENPVTKYTTAGGYITIADPDNTPIYIAILRTDANYTMKRVYEYTDKDGTPHPYTASSQKVYYTFFVDSDYEQSVTYHIVASNNATSASQAFTVSGEYRREPILYDVYHWIIANQTLLIITFFFAIAIIVVLREALT